LFALVVSWSTRASSFPIQERCGRNLRANKRKPLSPPTTSSALRRPHKGSGIIDLDGIAQGANGLAVAGPVKPRRGRKRYIVPCVTALVIGSFSIAEILEGSREISSRAIRRGHGVAILAVIRLLRSIAILQTQMDEFKEGTEKLGVVFEKTDDTTRGTSVEARLRSIPAMLVRLVLSPLVTVSACILAATASVLEIVEDMRPGAHHGAALLALSELNYQLHRLRQHATGKRLKWKSRIFPRFRMSSVLPSLPWKAKKLLSRVSLGSVVALAAAGFAVFEIFEDLQPGAHHAVAVLAAAEFVENINRSRMLKVA
jgi:hypothetical protein